MNIVLIVICSIPLIYLILSQIGILKRNQLEVSFYLTAALIKLGSIAPEELAVAYMSLGFAIFLSRWVAHKCFLKSR